MAAEEARGKPNQTKSKPDFQNPVRSHSKEMLFSISIRLFVFSSHCWSVGLRHAYPFLHSLCHCVGMTSDGRLTAPGTRLRTPAPVTSHTLQILHSRSQKTDSIHPASPVRRYITSTKIGHKEWHPRLRNGIPVIILDPVIVV